ncbi:MAG TPA: Rv3654c family TadE-like protein [Actinomycetota bacterium]|nr:Rv3654c family TadE-like protein [Actinomycetota bacterium]
MRQEGSASLLLAASLGLIAVVVTLTVGLASAAVGRAKAQSAADGAALAVAQELIVPSGQPLPDIAKEYAERNGARLVACRCEAAASDAVVTVEVPVELGFLGSRVVTASARAVVDEPGGSAAGLQPFFVARLSCLIDRVPGVWIVSGFRTHAEQAALHEAKPGLAAPPGHSMHELGLAADLGYPSEQAERSAHEAAPGCGLTFPMSYEPWHVEPAA